MLAQRIKRDWYIWADGGGEGEGPPNNWISVFGGSAWTYDNLTHQYYYHQFGSFQTNSEVYTGGHGSERLQSGCSEL